MADVLRRLDERCERPLRRGWLARFSMDDAMAQSIWSSLDPERQWLAWQDATLGVESVVPEDARFLLAIVDTVESNVLRAARWLAVFAGASVVLALVALAVGAVDMAVPLVVPLAGMGVGGLYGTISRLRRLRERRLQLWRAVLDRMADPLP